VSLMLACRLHAQRSSLIPRSEISAAAQTYSTPPKTHTRTRATAGPVRSGHHRKTPCGSSFFLPGMAAPTRSIGEGVNQEFVLADAEFFPAKCS
jgi:hypothetical protein